MLVLTRKLNEAIMIGGGITIIVVEIKGDRVRLGINAPKEVQIVRDNAKDTRSKDRG